MRLTSFGKPSPSLALQAPFDRRELHLEFPNLAVDCFDGIDLLVNLTGCHRCDPVGLLEFLLSLAALGSVSMLLLLLVSLLSRRLGGSTA